ncbi:MAG TPA: hypothetical protein VKP02_02725 [Gemmatimonadaceae bacterium]|nr:hypothetical protein [Gemmatimonadaceae bacterium]
MQSSMTRVQEWAMAVIAIAVVAIAIAAPIVAQASATWRAKAAGGLTMLEALITVVRRVLGV